MKKNFFTIFALCAVLFSCKNPSNVGLGTAIDLEPPVLTMTFPVVRNGVTTYVPRSFIMRGTCTDNVKVEKVTVTYSYTSNGAEFEKTVEAEIEDDTWSAPIEVSDDVDLEVTIIATDKLKNVSEESVKSLVACVDTENPYAKDFGVKKNGQLTTLKEVESLKALDENQSASKDDLQNEEFSVVATLTDNNIISGGTLSLYDAITGAQIIADRKPDITVTNVYKPVWTITKSDLIAVNDDYNSGRHYFTPKITVTDAAGNTESDIYGDSLCWYPESDLPKVLFPLATEGVITVGTGIEIPVSVFDDDGIAEIHYALVPDSDFKGNAYDTYIEESEAFAKADNIASAARDHNISLKTGSVAGKYYIVVAVQDKKQIEGYQNIWKYYSVITNVANADAPLIIVEEPQENTSASLTNNKFTLKGFSLDDASVITGNEKAKNSILIAWLPEGTTTKDAHTLLEAAAQDETLASPKTDSRTGIKIWKPKTVAATSKDSVFTSYYKDTFEQEFDVLEDFKVGGKLVNESKLFLIYIIDKTGNISAKTYRLGAYKIPPTIKVEYSSTGSGPWLAFDAAMMEYRAGGTIYFKVTPEHPNGLGIDHDTFEAKNGNDNITTTKTDDSYTFNFTASIGGRLDLSFKVKDVLGNEGGQKNTVVFADKATLQSITTDTRTGAILSAGSVLKVQANFSGNVGITGTPYIVLSNISGVSGEQRALYKKGNGTDTLIFEYEIKDGMYTASGNYVGSPATTGESPITVPSGASIDAATTGTFESIAQYRISIDAVPPKLVPASCTPKPNALISGTEITLVFDDEIEAESGTITVQRAAGWAIPPVLGEEEFKTVYAALNSENKTYLIGSDSGEPALIGDDTPNDASDDAGTPLGPYKKITHGLVLDGTEAVPDTRTKYVLAFDLDIYATTGTVAKIREILEGYGYHKTELDISECTVDSANKTLTFSVPDDFFAPGRKYEVLMTKGCVRDKAGNLNAAITRESAETTQRLTFWTDKVATPVIRVDRYTHGAGIQEPNASGVLQTKLTAATAFTTAPTGFARVRIDCETPNAAIKYGVISKTATLDLTNPPDALEGGKGKTENVNCENDESGKVTGIIAATSYTQNSVFTVGSASLTESGKYYIKAEATYGGSVTGQPEMAASEAGYEGAYKTVIYCNGKQNREDDNGTLTALTPSATTPFYIEGSSDLGEPTISGFPLRDANENTRYNREMYKLEDAYALVSYDIVSWFRMQMRISGYWAKGENTNCYYGDIIYCNDRKFW